MKSVQPNKSPRERREALLEEKRASSCTSGLHCSAPWVGRLRHSRNLCDDWGCIRDKADDCIIRVPLPTYDEDVLNEHRRNKTDPTQERVDYILAVLNRRNA
jgi:hypothetical protein